MGFPMGLFPGHSPTAESDLRYTLTRCDRLSGVLVCRRQERISTRALRVLCAIEGLDAMGRPLTLPWIRTGLAQAITPAQLRADLDALLAARILAIEQGRAVRLAGVGLLAEVAQYGRRRDGGRLELERPLAIPATVWLELARERRWETIGTWLGSAVRCLWRSASGELLGEGRCGTSFLTELTGLHARAVHRARATLRKRGLLEQLPEPAPWRERRFGSRQRLALRRPPIRLEVPVSGAENEHSSPPRSSRSSHPSHAHVARRRSRSRSDPARLRIPPTGPVDLTDVAHLRTVWRQARKALPDLTWPEVCVCAERARRPGTHNPGGLLYALLRCPGRRIPEPEATAGFRRAARAALAHVPEPGAQCTPQPTPAPVLRLEPARRAAALDPVPASPPPAPSPLAGHLAALLSGLQAQADRVSAGPGVLAYGEDLELQLPALAPAQILDARHLERELARQRAQQQPPQPGAAALPQICDTKRQHRHGSVPPDPTSASRRQTVTVNLPAPLCRRSGRDAIR
jgi:hypothetical protein